MLVSIGDNCIDRYVAPIAEEHVGGNALNVAANFVLHGLPAAYAGVVGTDDHGDRVVAALEAIGVTTAYVERRAGPTGVTEIELLQGDYRILREEYGVSDRVHLTPALLEGVRAQASQLHLTVSGRAQQLIEGLEEVDVPLSVDLGTVTEPSLLQTFAVLTAAAESAFVSVGAKMSDEEVRQLLTAIQRTGTRNAIATRGAAGASTLWQGRLISVPSMLPSAAIVDTLGAGDAFIAGFLASADLEGGLEERLLCGSRWSAEACSHVGAWGPRRLASESTESRPQP
jgi:fructoselysine 6-kinase